MDLYKQSCRNAKKAMPFMPWEVIIDMIKNQLVEIISMGIAMADRELNKDYIASADFNLDMDEKEFMKKLFGFDDEVSE